MAEKGELMKRFREHAEKSGFKLNKKEIVERVIESLIKRKEKYGQYYCPCRVITGNKGEDKKIICPCFWHKNEIKKDGRCKCGLFVKK